MGTSTTTSTLTAKHSASSHSLSTTQGNGKPVSVVVSTTPPQPSDVQATSLQAKFELVTGSTMKRLLVINDQHGDRVMREAVLDEFNKLIRYFQEEFARVRQVAETPGE